MNADVRTPPLPQPRIGHIDVVRGVAICGILILNVLSFGMGDEHLLNLRAHDARTAFDWFLGITCLIFANTKFVSMFSMLFGASLLLFIERAQARGSERPVLLSLRRNAVLFALGIVHALIWQGDVLTVYAVLAPCIILVRRWPRWLLWAIVAVTWVLSVGGLVIAQSFVGADGDELGPLWHADGELSLKLGALLMVSQIAFVIQMMVLGLLLYRNGFLAGRLSARLYLRVALVGVTWGVLVTSTALGFYAAGGFAADRAVFFTAGSALAVPPMACGYAALAIWLSRRTSWRLVSRLRYVGQMGLTNYLTQTLLGVFVLGAIANHVDISRTGCAVFVVAVWALQLWWSKAWLSRFTQGPFEWLWRSLTYARVQPLTRRAVETEDAVEPS